MEQDFYSLVFCLWLMRSKEGGEGECQLKPHGQTNKLSCSFGGPF